MGLFYRFIRGLIRSWLWISGTQYIGRENIPEDKSVMVIANHSSLGDPAMVGCAFPFQIVFLAKAEFRQNAVTNWLFSKLGVVFLKRGEADLAALRKAIKVLGEKKAVGIFPEGRRTPNVLLGEFKQGATFIAYKAKVKIIPVATINSKDVMRFWKRDKKVIIGPPIQIEAGNMNTGEVLEEYTEILHNTIKNMIISHSDGKCLPPSQ